MHPQASPLLAMAREPWQVVASSPPGPQTPASARKRASSPRRPSRSGLEGSARRRPQWDSTKQDLSVHKLTPEQLAARKARTVSKHNTVLLHRMGQSTPDATKRTPPPANNPDEVKTRSVAEQTPETDPGEARTEDVDGTMRVIDWEEELRGFDSPAAPEKSSKAREKTPATARSRPKSTPRRTAGGTGPAAARTGTSARRAAYTTPIGPQALRGAQRSAVITAMHAVREAAGRHNVPCSDLSRRLRKAESEEEEEPMHCSDAIALLSTGMAAIMPVVGALETSLQLERAASVAQREAASQREARIESLERRLAAVEESPASGAVPYTRACGQEQRYEQRLYEQGTGGYENENEEEEEEEGGIWAPVPERGETLPSRVEARLSGGGEGGGVDPQPQWPLGHAVDTDVLSAQPFVSPRVRQRLEAQGVTAKQAADPAPVSEAPAGPTSGPSPAAPTAWRAPGVCVRRGGASAHQLGLAHAAAVEGSAAPPGDTPRTHQHPTPQAAAPTQEQEQEQEEEEPLSAQPAGPAPVPSPHPRARMDGECTYPSQDPFHTPPSPPRTYALHRGYDGEKRASTPAPAVADTSKAMPSSGGRARRRAERFRDPSFLVVDGTDPFAPWADPA